MCRYTHKQLERHLTITKIETGAGAAEELNVSCRCATALLTIWGIVKIMVPFWVPIIIRGLIRGLI